MRLGLVMLDPASTVNNIKYLREVVINPGDTAQVLFQLVDLDTINQSDMIGNRYMPATGSTMLINIISVNDVNTISMPATMAFPNDDRSIWAFALTPNQTAKAAGVNMNIVLTQGSIVLSAIGKNVLIINPSSTYAC